MGAFSRKFKKTKLSIRLIYYFVLISFLVCYIFLFRSLLLLKNIETTLRVIALIVLGFLYIIYGFFNLLALLTKKHKTVIATSLIMIIIASFCLVGSLAINKIYMLLNNMNKSEVLYTTNLITLKKTDFKNDKEFKVGIINNETDVEGNVLAYELIKDKKLVVSLVKYDTYFEMLEKLYDGEIGGLFITSNFVTMYDGYEAYEHIDKDVKVIYEYSKEMKNQDYVETNGSVERPFTILLMGVDSKKDGLKANAAFNGDTLMLIAFNPKTLSSTVFSIPRDTYVPIACINSSSKINSSAAYGTECVIKTVENLTSIPIDYYVKINFKGVVSLVDALGGVDVTVPDGVKFCEQDSNRCKKQECKLCIEPGPQHMNGEQALAFARHRKTLPTGDFQRVQHQQLVVEGIANAAKNLSSVNDFYAVLDSVSRNMDTNMSTSEILNLYNVGKSALLNANKGNLINIQKTYLTGYDLTMYVQNLRSRVYTFQYYEQSLAEIVDALKVTLEINKPEIIKTFNFSVNDEYKVPIIGKKYYTVQRNETIPDFSGKKLEYVKTWCSSRSISVTYNYVKKGELGYNEGLSDGTVISQSVKRGVLVKDVKSISVSVIKKDEIKEEVKTTSTTTTKVQTSSKVVTSKTSKSTEKTTEKTTKETTTKKKEETEG